MTLFLQSIWCVGRQFIDTVDARRWLSPSIRWQFQGLQWLCFRCRFMDQQWQRFWQFHASVMNSLTLSIPCCSCDSVFINYFKVYSYSVLAGDLWISRDIVFLTMPCGGHDNIFACDWMRRSWIHWRCRFHAVPVTQYSLTVSRSTVTLFWPPIYRSAVT